MKKLMILGAAVMLAVPAMADTFGSGANQFTIDFVPISGDAGDLGSWSAGHNYTFSGVNSGDYRMGKYEITNDQWNKFKATYGDVKGTPTTAYDSDPYWTGTNVPTNCVSWYEAAQFVNWLNIEAGKTEAYKFTGTQGTSDYTLGVWSASDAWGGTNLYRHKDAYYFLPTEDEWVKAAYWNGTNLQTYATVGDVAPTQAGWNFYDNGYATDPHGPWAVGSSSQELNGTYDMMGNVGEWMESPYFSGDYLSSSMRGSRGAAYSSGYDPGYGDNYLASSGRGYGIAHGEDRRLGFRVASVPEPASLVLLGLGGLALRYRKR